MSSNGIKTTQLDSSPVLDEVLGNYEGVSKRIAFSDFLKQISPCLLANFENYVRVFADLDEIRAASLPDNSVLMVKSSGSRYSYNATGLRPDDGVYAVHDADGRVFDRVTNEVNITYVDVLLVMGQSNARGSSAIDTPEASPVSPSGIEIDAGVVTDPLADPLSNNAGFGSMWPAYANAWFELTGRKLVVVPTAVGSTGLLDPADGAWGPSGTLRANTVTEFNQAVSAVYQNYVGHEIGDVHAVWAQGEAEAERVNGTDVTGDLYRDALIALAGYIKANVAGFGKIGVVRLGDHNTRDDAAGFHEIRLAQDAACATSDNLLMLYRGTSGMSYDGRRLLKDDVHMDQAGLNIAGDFAAKSMYADTPPDVPTAPAFLRATAFSDTDTTVATPRTESHTVGSGTKLLIVAISVARVGSNTTSGVDEGDITFNGVDMIKANGSYVGLAAANGTTAGRTDIGLFYLNESDYGAALDGATGDLIVQGRAASNLIQFAVIECDAEGVQEHGVSEQISGSGASGTTLDVSINAGAPTFAVGIGSSVSDGAAALTYTVSGMTEVLDAGGSNGTRAGQAVVGYRSYTESAENVTTFTMSGTVTAAVATVVGFRGKLSEE